MANGTGRVDCPPSLLSSNSYHSSPPFPFPISDSHSLPPTPIQSHSIPFIYSDSSAPILTPNINNLKFPHPTPPILTSPRPAPNPLRLGCNSQALSPATTLQYLPTVQQLQKKPFYFFSLLLCANQNHYHRPTYPPLRLCHADKDTNTPERKKI
jgi:hypothetical protein